jgi:hypothetical protein
MLEILHRHLLSVNVNWAGVPSRSMSCSCAMSRRESPALTCRVVRSPSGVTNVNDNLPIRQRDGNKGYSSPGFGGSTCPCRNTKSQSEILEEGLTIRRPKSSTPATRASTHHPPIAPSLTCLYHHIPTLPSQDIP